MDETLIAVAHHNGGYLMRHQLNDLGVSDPMIRRAVRVGELRRVRHGTYVPSPVLEGLSSEEVYAIVVRSVVDKLGPGVVVSHQSAAALHGLDLWGLSLADVHVTRLDGRTGRAEAGVVFHEGRLDESGIVSLDGRPVVSGERTALETAMVAGIESGMVVLSSAMRLGIVEKESTEEVLVRDFGHWKGIRSARVALRLSDGRLESVGEVRSMHMMWLSKIPAPELQVEVRDRDGRTIGRSDFSWSWFRHLGEFDGMFKYGRLNPYGSEPGRQIEKEKVREDRMRATDRGMTRWIWNGLGGSAGSATGARLDQDMKRSRRLYCRNATHIV